MSTNRIKAMTTGGKLLRQIKFQLKEFTRVGTRFFEIEVQAQKLIKQVGAKPNFSMVPGYKWATCIMKNDQLCHGIPGNQVVKAGDVITIDVGLFYNGFHLDTSISFGVGEIDGQTQRFLEIGKKSLKKAINQAKVGNSIYKISQTMQSVVEKAGYGAVYQLCGHGIGKELHMEPNIPCVAQRSDRKLILEENQTIAIEIMYSVGNPYLILSNDGWTYSTTDGLLSGMFEETVLVTRDGPEVLT